MNLVILMALPATAQHWGRVDLAAERIDGSAFRILSDTPVDAEPGQVLSRLRDGAGVRSTDPVLSNGATYSPFWAVVELGNSSDRALTRQIVTPLKSAGDLRIFVSNRTGGFDPVLETSFLDPFDARPVQARTLITKQMVLEPGALATLLIAYRPLGFSALPLELATPAEVTTRIVAAERGLSAFYTAAVVLIVAFAGFCLVIRNRTGVMMAGLLALNLLVLAQFEGILFPLLWPQAPLFNLNVTIPMMLIAAICGYTAILRAGSGRLPRGTRRWLLAGAGLALLHLAATPFAHPTLVVPGAIMLWLLVFPAIVVALPHWEGFTPPQRRLGSMVAVMVFALACVKGAATLLPWLPAVVSGDGMLRLIFAVAAGGLMALLLMQVAELFRSNRAALEATAAAARKEAELNEALYTSERDYAEAMRKASGLRRRLEVTAHDIRQPLSALRHFLGRSAGAEEERQAMEEALDYLEGLAGPAPDVEAPAEPDAEPYRVDVVLSAVKQMLREEADTRAIDLSITAPPEATTITPALTLMRIVSNLAVNAIKHSGGSYVRLGATVAEGRTTVSVRNDGAVLSRPAFERYLGSGVKGAASEGDGLGLSIVADLSRAAGLDLSLDTSNPAETAIVVGLTPA